MHSNSISLVLFAFEENWGKLFAYCLQTGGYNRNMKQIVFLLLLVAIYVNHAYKMSDFDVMEVELGASFGIDKDKEISNETVQKVLEGVENGNKDSIYFFALMKLYGLSLSKEIKIAAKNSNIVGADINELSPIKGFNTYNFLVAKLAYKILSYTFGFRR